MRIKVQKKEENRLEMAIGGEGPTLLNLLQGFLLDHRDVEMAGYSKPHPLMDRSIIYINTRKGGSPEEALIDAAEAAKERMNEFRAKFTREIAKIKRRR